MIHPLEKWLEAQSVTKIDFANSIGVHRQTLWRLINVDSDHSTKLLKCVSKATGGAVSVADLIDGGAK